jgi:hypothetical protein
MSSILKVDTIQDQSGNNIINENADTITIGASGDTVTIPSGATLSSTDPLVFPAGTVSLPAITTTGDTNTGIFFPSADTIAFTEGGAEAMRINSDGNVTLTGNIGIGGATPTTSGTGITFPATQSASTNANTLDDYEEGTWTPTYVASTTDFTSITYQAQNGTYTKIGRLVIVNIVMSTNSITVGAAAGEVYIDGLPFTPIQNGSNGTVLYGATNWAGDNPDGWTTFGNTRGYLFYRTGTTFSSINPADLGTGGSANNYIATLTYFV